MRRFLRDNPTLSLALVGLACVVLTLIPGDYDPNPVRNVFRLIGLILALPVFVVAYVMRDLFATQELSLLPGAIIGLSCFVLLDAAVRRWRAKRGRDAAG
ncbi:MAG: hypothetical protein IT357_16185 [Gemmatimonadaceae bacterium]|nr:hypothetical protein [Gemmatimonadaceae bacterium]